MASVDHLERLVAFPSVSARPNLDIADYVAGVLERHGCRVERIWSEPERKVNLFATLGPNVPGGMILSGHMDVVPVEGQAWTLDPFRLLERDGRLYGRGTTDMKGFVACMLGLVERLDPARLRAPLHLCISCDEEIGCVGVRPMLDSLAARQLGARLCIVGEPTNLAVATGHKGKVAAAAICHGVEGHSALAPEALNAIHLACDMVAALRSLQARLAAAGRQDPAYAVPYSTVHVGRISGGTALNIVPNRADLLFEIRSVGGEDGLALLDEVRSAARTMVEAAQRRFAAAAITIDIVNAYPGLDTAQDDPAIGRLADLVGDRRLRKMAYGTEGGLFAERLGVPTLVCGPGSMEQGHKPDEFIARREIDRCDCMLDGLVDWLAAP